VVGAELKMRACPQICHVCVSDKKNPEKIHGRDRDGRVVWEARGKVVFPLAFSPSCSVSNGVVDTNDIKDNKGNKRLFFIVIKLP